ncbi:immunity protein Imm33 domain-containing protein [Bacillus pseudomycoides]|uniref:Imm33-like domain-containing protein n=1 Tax=Bacillus pseudomycoides TaxID=64104 RepID=A0A2B5U8P4_9BACI|nr:hypothetical protein [Bacillus pseudomycoides]PDY46429.1 hypothetical protein CON79_15260 [Bacillus pseudomycoides]PEA81161.1 hypothetical protein CON99_23855 [Bacillus pseudomycoides]PED08440.1 hypothetical protein COO19_09720 [Bacillus pseudomycoides]PED69084.1 hypothetical protein CON97_27325 [Bacillus pseudomycoides]PEI43968.1 hypothetical protein CN620_06250 [Bacillus pseudomycoides]
MEKFIKKIGDKTFIAQAEKIFAVQVEGLFHFLTEVENDRLIDGFSIQVGWSIYFLDKREDGYHIIVHDYTKNPFEDMTDDLTISLWILLTQVSFLKPLTIEGELLRFCDKIVAAKNVLELDNIYLERTKGCEKGDSGWYIGPVNDEHNAEEYEALYAYELLKLRPSLIRVLTLPFEYLVIFEKDELKAVVNERNVNIMF